MATLEIRLKDRACIDETVDTDHETLGGQRRQAKRLAYPQENCLMHCLLFDHCRDGSERDCQCRKK